MSLLFSILLLLLLPFIYRTYNQILMKRKCRVNGYIVLTYDDGPNTEMTPELLDLLERTQTKATFFVLGSKVANNVSIIQKMADLGHEIGCHGYSHLNAWKSFPWVANHDIVIALEALSKAQIKCKIFRPPYGKITIFTFALIIMKNMKSAWWTIVSGDTFPLLPNPSDFVEKVIKEGGGVVLMHDFHKSNLRKEFVLEVTSLLIVKSKQHGLLFKTLGEIL